MTRTVARRGYNAVLSGNIIPSIPKILEQFGNHLVAFWPLNENVAGSSEPEFALDISGNGYHGTNVNIQAGKPPVHGTYKSYYFDGTAYINTFSLAFRQTTSWRDEGTALAWGKPTSIPVGKTPRILNFNVAGGPPNSFFIDMRVADSPPRYQVQRGGSDGVTRNAVININLNQNLLFGFTWSVTNNYVRPWINGVMGNPNTAGTVSAGMGTLNDAQTVIGEYTIPAGNSPFYGFLQYIILIDTPLSANNMLSFYNKNVLIESLD